jgi:hypothetical protein
MAETTREWLDSLKVGDEVVLKTSSAMRGSTTDALVEVTRLTATQVVLKGGARFRKRDGEDVGADTFTYRRIHPATPRAAALIREAAKRRNLVERIARATDRGSSWGWLPTDDLESIVSILDNARQRT